MAISVPPTSRICTKCHQEKPLEEFAKSPDCFYGHAYVCKECKNSASRLRMRQWRADNPGRNKQNRIARKDKNKKYQRDVYQRLKKRVMEAYGHCCVCCGEKNFAFLTIDHVYNDGYLHRGKSGRFTGVHIYRWLEKHGYPKGRVQILCYNCNGAKQHDPDGHRLAHACAVKVEGPPQLSLWGTEQEVRVQTGLVSYTEEKEMLNRWGAPAPLPYDGKPVWRITHKKQLRVVQLRKEGMSWSQIAKQLGYANKSGARHAWLSAIKNGYEIA